MYVLIIWLYSYFHVHVNLIYFLAKSIFYDILYASHSATHWVKFHMYWNRLYSYISCSCQSVISNKIDVQKGEVSLARKTSSHAKTTFLAVILPGHMLLPRPWEAIFRRSRGSIFQKFSPSAPTMMAPRVDTISSILSTITN